MKKLILILAIALTLSACSDDMKSKTKNTDNTICIDGVTYVAFKEKEMVGYHGYGFLSVKLNRESKIIECSQDEENK